jgi:hypothetical protein
MILDRGPLELVKINEKIFERKSSDSGIGTEVNDCEGSAALTKATPLYPSKLTIVSLTSGRRSQYSSLAD